MLLHRNIQVTLVKALNIKLKYFRAISLRSYTTDFSSTTKPIKKSKKRTKSEKEKIRKEIPYEEESNKYILEQLLESKKQFDSKNTQLAQISSQFKDVLQLFGLILKKAPLSKPITFNEEAIHISKTAGDTDIDLLLDYRTSPETLSRDTQVIFTNADKPDQVLYFMGQFTKEEGLIFDTCMSINTTTLNKNSVEIRDAICNGEKWIFNALNNQYQKPLLVSSEEVRKFLLSKEDEDYDFSDMHGRMFVDALVNYTILESLGLRIGAPESARIRHILWILGTYCENNLQGVWLSDLISFIRR